MYSRQLILILALTAISIVASQVPAEAYLAKEHDFLPNYHKVFLVVDSSATMNQDCADTCLSRLSVAIHSLEQFYNAIPTPPLWQYPFLTSLVVAGNPGGPRILVPLQTGTPGLFEPYYKLLAADRAFHPRASCLGDALEFCAGMGAESFGKTAVVVFTDGETSGQVAQLTAQSLKQIRGDTFSVFGVFVGDSEDGLRNLFKLCKGTGGYVRSWREILNKKAIADFVRDILVREISFHYVEIFFRIDSADLLPSEAGKLENVAHFLQMIPSYDLIIDGYSIPGSEAAIGRRLALQRAEVVKKALVHTYKVSRNRIIVHSMGCDYPRYRHDDPGTNLQNAQSVLYLRLPLRGAPYDEKHLHTFGRPVTGVVMNDRERNSDVEWAWPLSWSRGLNR